MLEGAESELIAVGRRRGLQQCERIEIVDAERHRRHATQPPAARNSEYVAERDNDGSRSKRRKQGHWMGGTLLLNEHGKEIPNILYITVSS